MMSGTAFRVQWELFSPVIVPGMPVHLDALLSWARVFEAEMTGQADPLAVQHDLPLERHETEHGWCFKASALNFEYAGDPQRLHYIRRSDIDELAEPYSRGVVTSRNGAPAFDTSRGMHKAGSFLLTQRFAREVTAYGVGDIDRVRELLCHVTSLGKLRRRAKGAVRSFTVQAIEDTTPHWAQRNLPVGSPFAGPFHAMIQQRLHAPYWAKERHVVLAPADFLG